MATSSPTEEETIAAIVTAPGEAGVSIVRVSGPLAFPIADAVFCGPGKKPSERDPNTFVHGHIVQGETPVDEVLLLIMRSPHSYTAEDVIEIQGHGGRICATRILRTVLDQGARPAEPGEFTKRAFLNGRIDLLQAEAVLDLIQARSERSAAAALEQLEGGLTRDFDRLFDQLITVSADIESTLDFPEEDLPHYVMPDLTKRLTAIRNEFQDLVKTWDEGHFLRDGLLLVISGRPNVGKSTLLNVLLDKNRAIVSNRPGTTRDTIEEGFVLGGIPFRVVDTAGLRDADCEIEQEGISRARSTIEKADLHLYVIDSSEPLAAGEGEQLKTLDPGNHVVVLNKSDLGSEVGPESLAGFVTVQTALKDGDGVEELKVAILERIESRMDLSAKPHAVISERHRRILKKGEEELAQAQSLMEAKREDLIALVSTHMRTALELIGTATGREYEESLLDNIFSRFCVGK